MLSRLTGWLLAGALACAGVGCGDAESSDGTDAGSAGFGDQPVGWTRLPPPPKSPVEAGYVWTGSELIVWGGCNESLGYVRLSSGNCRAGRAGYAYSPGPGTWRHLPDAPIGGTDPTGVWTGEEVLFIDVGFDCEPAHLRGVAYSPSAETWRRLPPVPLSAGPRCEPVMAWTGDELVVLSGLKSGQRAVAYHPRSDQWRRIADPPGNSPRYPSIPENAVWTGEEVVVFGARLPERSPHSISRAGGAAYDPEEDDWTELPPSKLSPNATATAWAGDRLLAWSYELESQEYDPASRTWSSPAQIPIDFAECYPQNTVAGNFVLGFYCGLAALYDPERKRWKPLKSGPFDAAFRKRTWNDVTHHYYLSADSLTSAGSVAIVALRAAYPRNQVPCKGCGRSLTSLWAYRPG